MALPFGVTTCVSVGNFTISVQSPCRMCCIYGIFQEFLSFSLLSNDGRFRILKAIASFVCVHPCCVV